MSKQKSGTISQSLTLLGDRKCDKAWVLVFWYIRPRTENQGTDDFRLDTDIPTRLPSLYLGGKKANNQHFCLLNQQSSERKFLSPLITRPSFSSLR